MDFTTLHVCLRIFTHFFFMLILGYLKKGLGSTPQQGDTSEEKKGKKRNDMVKSTRFEFNTYLLQISK